MIIDSHVHFFDANRREGVVWPPVSSPIYAAGKAMPEQRRKFATVDSLDGVIAVETSRRASDDEWLLSLAERDALVLGAVLNLQPDESGFEQRLQAANNSAAFVGVRLRPIADYDLDSELLRDNLRLLEKHNKTIEFGAPEPRLKIVMAELAATYTETTFILDHAGHPHAGSDQDKEWLAAMREIAAQPNIAVKVTFASEQLGEWQSVLDVLVELFGSRRLLFGSNWPVNEITDVAKLKAYFGDDAAAFFSGNARVAYGLRAL